MAYRRKWYTKAEQSARAGIWSSAEGLAQIFGGLVAYGIAHGGRIHHFDVAPWKVVFILNGCLTILGGSYFLIVVPRNQLSAWWLSEEERLLAVERIRTNVQGIGNRKFKLRQFNEAMTDPFTWAIFIAAIALDIPSGGLTNYFSQLIVSFGFSPEQSLLYGTPSGVVAVASFLLWGFLSQRFGNRILWAVLAELASMIGVILIVALPLKNRVGRLLGYYMTGAFPVGLASLLSLVSSNVAG